MNLLGGFLIASCACVFGFIFGALMASGKCDDLQQQIDAKRDNWCGECKYKLDAKGFDEQLLHERRSRFAMCREKDKRILELAKKLQDYNRTYGIDQLNKQVAR